MAKLIFFWQHGHYQQGLQQTQARLRDIRVVQPLLYQQAIRHEAIGYSVNYLTMLLHLRVNCSASRPGRRNTVPAKGNEHRASQGHVLI